MDYNGEIKSFLLLFYYCTNIAKLNVSESFYLVGQVGLVGPVDLGEKMDLVEWIIKRLEKPFSFLQSSRLSQGFEFDYDIN